MASLENILSPQIVQKLGWTLLHFVWQAAVVALLLAILLRVLRKSSANLRYIAACSALAFMVLMPAITFNFVPGPEPAHTAKSVPISTRVSTAPQEPYDTEIPLARAAEYMQMSTPTSWKQRVAGLLEPALPYAVLGWLVGVFGLSIWHLGGWAQLHRLKTRMVEDVSMSLRNTLQQLSAKLGVKKVVQVVESAFVQVPTVVGWLRPVILLPASALTGLTSEQLEALLVHELAHIKRLDYLVNMLQTAVEILGFYHPAVWWISHTIRLERENCCDDMAVSICGDARQYAKALAEMERIRSGEVELSIAASGGNLSRRISRLLGKEAGGKTHASWVPAVIAAILLIALTIPASLALSGADAEDTSAAAISNLAAGTTTDEMLPPAPSSAEITDKPQIAFECKFIEVPADSEFVKGKSPGNIIMRLDGEFSSLLEALIRATQGAHVLTAPKVIVLEGEEANMRIGEDRPCIACYEPSVGGDEKSKPIIKHVFCGLELKIKAEVVNSDRVHMDIHLTTRSKPTEQKDASGRTIHATASSDYTSQVTVNDGETIIISGPKDEDRPNQTLILQITPHIIRPDERIGIPAKPGIKDQLVDAKITSNQKLQDLGKAMVFFAQAHQRALPDTLQEFAPYLRNKQDIEWLSQNVEYLGKGITEAYRPDTVIAYDKSLLKSGQGTNVLFLDAHVEYVQADRLEKLGITSEIKSAEEEQRVKSLENLKQLGLAVNLYADEHDNKLPDRLEELKPHFDDEEIFLWALNNVKYLGQGISREASKSESTPIAYDKNLYDKVSATVTKLVNVVFLDGHVESITSEKFNELVGAVKRLESAKKLSNLGKALLIYANDYTDRYPDSLPELREYLKDEELKWASANVKYLGKGKTTTVRPDMPVAYDKTLLAEGKGTNVLFNDSHVEFVKPDRLKELGIGKTAIEIETRILRVSEDFLKDIGLDANSIRDANSWPEAKPSVAQASEGSDTYSLILNDLNVSFLLKATQAHKGPETLAAPKVVVLDGKEARLAIQEAVYYVSGYTESKRPSGEPEPKHDSLNKGLELQLMPKITPDNKHILLDVNFRLCELIRFETRMYKEKHPYEIPEIDMVDFQTRVAVPDRETLLIGGQKVTVEVERESTVPILGKLPIIGRAFRSYSKIKDQKMLLILIKPTVLLQE
jgi:prepilin-type processing-associated H-X9-DG protein